MEENKIIDLYKKQLAQSPEKAPEGLWDDIAREMDEKQLIHHYREELAQSSEKAPLGLWDDIERKMDIDEVWAGVATGLDNKKKSGGFWWFNRGVAAAIAILLISTMSIWFMRNLSSTDAELAGTEAEWAEPVNPAIEGLPEATTADAPHARQPEQRATITSSNGQDEVIQESERSAIASLPEQDFTFQEDRQDKENSSADDFPALNPLAAATASLAATNLPSIQELSILSEEENNYRLGLTEATAGSGLLALGFTAAMKNTWLFNHETFQGFDPGSGSRTHVQIYPDIAVSLRYLLSQRWKMESSLSLSSSNGQSYEQYIYGRYSKREIALSYFHAEVMAGYNHRKRWVVRSNTISHSTSVGLYYGVLNAANESIAGDQEDVSTNYRKDDYGIVTGHNLNIPIYGNLMFSPGMYITWGLPNIYQGNYILPSLKRTYNRTVELRFSLYYNFTR